MGISDDIRPKRSYSSKKTTDVPVWNDNFEEENDIDIKNDELEDEPKELDHKELEELENDFFDNKHTKKKKKEQETENKPGPAKSQPKRSIAKPTVWIMVILLLGLLVWQNRSEIISAIENQLGINDNSDTAKEENKPDEYYTGETTGATESTTTSTKSEAEQETATPAPAPEIKKDAIVMEILNGNGIKGSAEKVKTELETAGFKISKVANAKNFAYKTTLIYFKTGKDKEANLVKASLAGREVSTENNDSKVGDYDIIIIVGAK